MKVGKLNNMQISMEIPSRLGEEIVAMEKVALILEKLQFTASRIEEIKTVVSESVLNAIEHGNHFDDGKSVLMTLKGLEDHFLLIVEDFGLGISGDLMGENIIRPILNKIGRRGLGLYFINQFTDKISSEIYNKKHFFKVEFGK